MFWHFVFYITDKPYRDLCKRVKVSEAELDLALARLAETKRKHMAVKEPWMIKYRK